MTDQEYKLLKVADEIFSERTDAEREQIINPNWEDISETWDWRINIPVPIRRNWSELDQTGKILLYSIAAKGLIHDKIRH